MTSDIRRRSRRGGVQRVNNGRGRKLRVESLENRLLLTTVILESAKDNTLYEDVEGDLSNGSGQYLFAGRGVARAATGIRRGLVAFDLDGAIPDGSTIASVTLSLNLSRSAGSGSATVSVHEVSTDWGEGASDANTSGGGPGPGGGGTGAAAEVGDATWLHTFFDTETWSTPGGDFDSASASASIGNILGRYTWGSTDEMVEDVQGWLDDSSTNHGWLLMGDESLSAISKRFDTRENTVANRPTLTVEFDEAPAEGISISDVAMDEGNLGVTTQFDFEVTLSSPAEELITVEYQTVDSTAIAGDDYVAIAVDTLTFEIGEDTKTVTVLVNGDTLVEADETFSVVLSNAVNSTILDTTGTGTILNDDTAVMVIDRSVAVLEGDSGTTEMTFSVNLTNAVDTSVRVKYITADITATAGVDYERIPPLGDPDPELVFAANETSQTIVVKVIGDTIPEPDETFWVSLYDLFDNNRDVTFPSNPPDRAGIGTIIDDDAEHLGVVDFLSLPGQDPSSGLMRWRLTTAHTALLTLDAGAASGSGTVGLALYDENFDLLETTGLGDAGRIDRQASEGELFFVEMQGTSDNVSFAIANLVNVTGTSVMVYGTEKDDTFEFDASASRNITINGVGYPFDDSEVTEVNFDAGGQDETDEVRFRDSIGDERFFVGPLGPEGEEVETATFSVTDGTVTSPYMVTAVNFEHALAWSTTGGFDRATLHDTAFNDRVKATAQDSETSPNQNWLIFRPGKSAEGPEQLLPLREFFRRTKNFEEVTVIANSGGDGDTDTADMFDSRLKDTLRSGQTVSRLEYRARTDGEIGEGDPKSTPHFFQVEMIDKVTVSASNMQDSDDGPNGGNDVVRFSDSAADDVFKGTPDKLELLPKGDLNPGNPRFQPYQIIARDFETMIVDAGVETGDSDEIRIVDSADSDSFLFDPVKTEMSQTVGAGEVASYVLTARNFAFARVSNNAGVVHDPAENDTAELRSTETLNDLLRGTDGFLELLAGGSEDDVLYQIDGVLDGLVEALATGGANTTDLPVDLGLLAFDLSLLDEDDPGQGLQGTWDRDS